MASSLPSVSISDHDIPQSGVEIDPVSTDTLLPPPRTSLSVPSTVKSSIGINNPAQGGLFPLPNSQQVAGKKKNRVALGKGFSLMDWIRLTKSGKDLTGVGGSQVGGKVREVTRQELRMHRKRKDAWMALNGAVYNVTHYMDYHPGGWDELVKGAGRDATDMFNEIHKWVNYQGLLEACLVGKLVDGPIKEKPSLPPPASSKPVSVKQTLSGFLCGLCSVLPPIPSKPAAPNMDFSQTERKVAISIYTGRKGISKENVILDNTQESIRILVFLPNKEAFVIHTKHHKKVELPVSLSVESSSGKVEVDLTKCEPNIWPSIGEPTGQHNWFGSIQDLRMTNRDWTVSSINNVTPDTKHIVLDPPQGTMFTVPTGHHVQILGEVEGMEISRSYTPVRLFHTAEVTPSLHFLIKVYPEGALTPQIGKLSPGDQVCVSDHTGSFSMAKLSSCQNIYLLAAGTGCTPIFSLLHQLSRIKTDIQTKLLFFNKTQADIIWQKELADYQACHPWLSVVHVLSEEGEEWEGSRGRARKELLEKYFGNDEDGKFAAVCGPNGFTTEADRLLKEELLFKKEEIHIFKG